jgi:outer membrane lipoprotein LolB
MFARACFPKLPDRKKGRGAIALAALLLVSGCATTRSGVPLPSLDSWESRVAVLGQQSHWEFNGRIAVKAGDEGFNGKISWSQQASEFSTTVAGPLGIGAVRIEGDERGIVLTDKEGLQTVMEDAESELMWRYGWSIPVASLRYWALGIPDPATPAITEFDAEGRLRALEQGNWRVDFSRYREAAGQSMPRILTATNPDTRVRMVIDSWLFFGR